MRRFIVTLAALALSACSQNEEAAAPEATPTSSAANPAPAQADKVPAAFLGVWDYVRGSCDPASDLRIEIKPDAIEFYEAHGNITKIIVESPETVVLDLAMDGEGEQWTMSRRFNLSNGGETLTPTGMDDEGFEPMPLKRCES